ncbi:MAG: methylisocitrate lyase [Planctomycetaceae bacterium]
MTSLSEQLRETVQDSILQVPGVGSALLARMAQRIGFQACYFSGAAFASGSLGIPDIGLFTLSELSQAVGVITRRIDIPMIVDADTGFGGPLHVERTMQELGRVNAAAVQLEDQQLPKRCGHLSGKTLITTEEMCQKLRAAANANAQGNPIIIARTDARDLEGIDAAIERAKRYIDAGAEWIFPEALTSPQEFEKFAREVEIPLVANMTEFGKSPLLTLDELSDMGYAAVLYPVTLQRVMMRAAEAAMGVIASDGTQESILDLMQTREELYDLIEYQDFEERDRHMMGDGSTWEN